MLTSELLSKEGSSAVKASASMRPRTLARTHALYYQQVN